MPAQTVILCLAALIATQLAIGAAIDYRQEMRNFVIGISKYAKAVNPNFAVLPQNGIELVSSNGEPDGSLATNYTNAIDGVGQEDLFFGYDNDNQATKPADTQYIRDYLDRIKSTKKVLVTDYCSGQTNMDKSYTSNKAAGYISFAADHRELDNIPTYPAQPRDVSTANITALSQAKNFLYHINPSNYDTKSAFINAVKATNFDVVLMDAFLGEDLWTASELAQLKKKANGGKRLVISYMSIGEAESYRYYWQADWKVGSPSFIQAENPDWKGNYKVQYWNKDWQAVIFGNDNSYLKKIVSAGFDGVYLDIIDAFWYFEG
ncbi:hypothetical protein AAVH_39430 [Aphelenchoides avenae]|nr:hypothetical protein AAVH_39430 [Aphelenchus avenae]